MCTEGVRAGYLADVVDVNVACSIAGGQLAAITAPAHPVDGLLALSNSAALDWGLRVSGRKEVEYEGKKGKCEERWEYLSVAVGVPKVKLAIAIG